MLQPYIIAGALWVCTAIGLSLDGPDLYLVDQDRGRLVIGDSLGPDSSKIDFLATVASCQTTKGFGRLQNTSHSTDSVDKIGSLSFYCRDQSYEIVCVYRSVDVRSRLSQDSAARLFLESEDWQSNCRDYHCFSFVYKMKDPDYLADDEDEVEFPTKVAMYQRVGPRVWECVGTTTVGSYSELSEIMFRTIYTERER